MHHRYNTDLVVYLEKATHTYLNKLKLNPRVFLVSSEVWRSVRNPKLVSGTLVILRRLFGNSQMFVQASLCSLRRVRWLWFKPMSLHHFCAVRFNPQSMQIILWRPNHAWMDPICAHVCVLEWDRGGFSYDLHAVKSKGSGETYIREDVSGKH